MKAVVWLGDSVALREVPAPGPACSEVLVRVGYASICGSDVTIAAGKHPRAKPPLILGHEFMGAVAQAPEGSDLHIGQRVVIEPLLSCKACRPCLAGHEHVCRALRLLGVEADGGFAEYVSAPADKVYPLPAAVSSREAALVEPLAVAVHAVDLGQVVAEDAVAVLGAGPVGLLLAQVAREAGVERLWLLEKNPYRLLLARSLGFSAVDVSAADPLQTVLDLTGGYGADVTFEAAGVPETTRLAVPLTAIRGRIVMVAIHKKPVEVELQTLTYREQTIVGSRIYARGDFRRAIALSESGAVQLRPLITHVFSLDEGVRALETATQSSECCKVLLEVHAD